MGRFRDVPGSQRRAAAAASDQTAPAQSTLPSCRVKAPEHPRAVPACKAMPQCMGFASLLPCKQWTPLVLGPPQAPTCKHGVHGLEGLLRRHRHRRVQVGCRGGSSRRLELMLRSQIALHGTNGPPRRACCRARVPRSRGDTSPVGLRAVDCWEPVLTRFPLPSTHNTRTRPHPSRSRDGHRPARPGTQGEGEHASAP